MPATRPKKASPQATTAAAKVKTVKRGKSAPAVVKSDDLQIGARVKHARILAGKRMRDLAHAVGCTESMISKIESGGVVPSLSMLQRLVAALDRDMSSFFGSDLNSPGMVLRAGQRPVLKTDPLRESPGVSYERLVPFAAGNLLECNIHVIEAGGSKSDRITHQGETVGYVIEGQLELTIETTAYNLSAG